VPFILQRVLQSPVQSDTATRGDTGLTRSAAFQVLSVEALRIGRGTNAELHLRDNAVALEHAVIREEAGEYHVEDRDSITGTYRNGRRLRPEVPERLRDGDEIELGPFRLIIQQASERDPLLVQVERIPGGGQGLAPPPIDYVRAYRLRRGVLNKGFLSVGLVLAALAASVALPLLDRNDVYQPGPLSRTHSERRLPGSDRLPLGEVANNCAACHDPWGGVATARCLECHTEHGGPRAHAATASFTPRCADCHAEHRGRELTRVENAACVRCHGNLVTAGEPTAFARQVTGIGEGRHPGLALTVLVEGEPRRISVAAAQEERLDPGRLRFNHARHLAPEGLRVRGEILYPACSDCHGVDSEGVMQPILYEQHCQSCHPLHFDPAFPNEQAEHGEPQGVEDSVWGIYWRAGGGGRLVGRREGGRLSSQVGSSRLQKTVTEKARRAAYRLFGAECAKCHQLDLEADPVAVEPPGIVGSWFPHARFLHGPHLEGETGDASCVDCHGGAEASEVTGDVLMPDIDSCTTAGCHVGTGESRRAAGEVVSSDCRQCHGYHGSRARAEAPLTPLAVAGTLEAFQGLRQPRSSGSPP
jgi:predicted CXXCH cytochrome family protein